MPDLLLELFCEEIPARMQAKAADDLRRLVTDALVARGLVYEGAKSFVTPRRLALHVAGLPVRGQELREEKKGPRVGAPEGAIQGFLKSAGLTSIDQATIESDPKKGEFYVAVSTRPGQMTLGAIAEIVPQVIRSFPWPKSMRWGAASKDAGALRWVRPLQSILCTFGAETEEPEIVPFDVDGIVSGNVTSGHRFLSDGRPIRVRRYDDYVSSLEKAFVVLDRERRKEIILADARTAAFAQGLDLIEDEGLLDEVAGLVEWPVVLMGSFDARFLDIPGEAIRATIRANQKCFVLRDPASLLPLREKVDAQRTDEGTLSRGQTPHPTASPPPSPARGEGKLANRFILTANIIASDGGAAIIAGNERVVRARLSDARYFFETDCRPLPDYADKAEKPLDQRLEKLKALNIVFHAKLGTQGERIERIALLARELAPIVGADADLCERAARLAKADLVTEMVGEFPELQGLMGRKYAELQGEHPSVCAAIEDHYKPLGPSDRVPTDPVAVTVALADKLDTLVGFWAIDEKPTGSKDPYALRRAALGVIRLVLENGVRVNIGVISQAAFWHLYRSLGSVDNLNYISFHDSKYYMDLIAWSKIENSSQKHFDKLFQFPFDILDLQIVSRQWIDDDIWPISSIEYVGNNEIVTLKDKFKPTQEIADNLLSFFHDRLKVQLREQGVRHDLVDAVLGSGGLPSPLAGESARRADEGFLARSGMTDEGQANRIETPHPTASPPPSPARGEGRSGVTSVGHNDDLVLIVRRVEALTAFLSTEDGVNLLAGYKRAANILRAEEKKDGEGAFEAAPDASLIAARGEDTEKTLAGALEIARSQAAEAVAREDFGQAMAALSSLRQPVDAFFENVIVNADDPAMRINRLRLLAQLRAATRTVADFGKIAG